MRLWSIHPKYLDQKGLVALWREGLLALKVLKGETKGYKNHPQLNRFKETSNPLEAISFYLLDVWFEANRRGYKFDISKVGYGRCHSTKVSSAQMFYERSHLQNKLKIRDLNKFLKNQELVIADCHPLFEVYESDKLEEWEKV